MNSHYFAGMTAHEHDILGAALVGYIADLEPFTNEGDAKRLQTASRLLMLTEMQKIPRTPTPITEAVLDSLIYVGRVVPTNPATPGFGGDRE